MRNKKTEAKDACKTLKKNNVQKTWKDLEQRDISK